MTVHEAVERAQKHGWKIVEAYLPHRHTFEWAYLARNRRTIRIYWTGQRSFVIERA